MGRADTYLIQYFFSTYIVVSNIWHILTNSCSCIWPLSAVKVVKVSENWFCRCRLTVVRLPKVSRICNCIVQDTWCCEKCPGYSSAVKNTNKNLIRRILDRKAQDLQIIHLKKVSKFIASMLVRHCRPWMLTFIQKFSIIYSIGPHCYYVPMCTKPAEMPVSCSKTLPGLQKKKPICCCSHRRPNHQNRHAIVQCTFVLLLCAAVLARMADLHSLLSEMTCFYINLQSPVQIITW